MKRITCCLLSFVALYPAVGHANKLLKSEYTESAFKMTKFKSDKAWELSTEVGGSFTSGNTDTQAYKAKVKGSFLYSLGRFNYHAQLYKKISNDKVSADKWKVGVKNNLDFSEHSSSFVTAEYEVNEFATYDSVATFAAGYTQLMFNDKDVRWDADIGPGYKWRSNDEKDLREYVMHLGTNLSFKITEHAKFLQTLIADFGIDGEATDIIRGESAILTSVLKNLKMKLTYAFRHDKKPGEGKEKLDSQTTVSLVYIF